MSYRKIADYLFENGYINERGQPILRGIHKIYDSKIRGDLIMKIDKETYDQIAELIHSDESPVGIDAKKTHILILHKLNQIEKRLDALEKQLKSERE